MHIQQCRLLIPTTGTNSDERLKKYSLFPSQPANSLCSLRLKINQSCLFFFIIQFTIFAAVAAAVFFTALLSKEAAVSHIIDMIERIHAIIYCSFL